MRKTFLKVGKPLAAAGIAAALFMFPALTPAWGQDIIPATPSGNNVNVKSDVTGDVYGGKATGSASSNGNTVTITGGHITGTGKGHVYGGCTEDQDATGNTIKITNARVDGIIFGGHVDKGTGPTIHANNNSVILGPGADIRNNVYGAYTNANGELVGNSVIIDGAAVGHSSEFIAGGYANSGSSPVSGNSVTINSGNIQSVKISGGRGQSTTINGNKVTINGGTIIIKPTGGIHGGERLDGFPTTGTVDNNSVSITGGTITGSVYGGYSNHSLKTSANNNSVSIYGGTVTGDIYGGYSNNGDAMNNSVTIGGAPTITGKLYGGDTGGGNAFTGNLLQLMEYRGSSVTSVQNFELYRFCLPPTLDYGHLVAGTVNFTGPSGAVSTVREVHIMTTGEIAQPPGGKITLIQSGSFDRDIGNKYDGQKYGPMSVLQGSTLYFTGKLDQNANELFLYNVSAPQVNPPAKAIVEGSNTVAVPLQRQGADLVAGPGLAQAMEATAEVSGAEAGTYGVEAIPTEAQAVSEECLKGGPCWKSFSALSGGRLRYNTGSKADLDSLSLLTGLARGVDLPPGRLTLGGFMEYGVGSYRTNGNYGNIHTNFDAPYLNIQGDGSAWHIGGGLLARQNIDMGRRGSHAYVEASLRTGEAHNRYSHLYPVEFMGNMEYVGFEASAPYYGAHSGLGYLWNMSDVTGLDIYGKYLWSRQAGYSVNLKPFGDPIKFEAVDSRRLQTGFRLSHAVNEKLRPYIGAAYEYEFDSEARATTHGLAIDSHSFGGSTEMGEVGLSYKPVPDRPVTLDFGLQGYTGIKEGITGSIQLKIEF